MTYLSSDTADAATLQSAHRRATISAPPSPAAGHALAGRALNVAATGWFGVAVLGQLLMVLYVIGFYGRSAIQGDFAAWNKVLPHGYVVGDTFGNLVLSLHLAFAALITVGGVLQLLPSLRQRWPRFHRWNGRVYLIATVVMSVGGLIMVWTRGTVGDLSQHIAISINALLILTAAAMALRHALARRFDLHRRWALRLFLAVSGVWFFRVGLMFWIVVNQGPVGFDPKSFTGPFLTILAIAAYDVLPLAILQLYFRAQSSTHSRVRMTMAVGLLALTLMMAVGIAAAAMLLWLPRL